MAGDKVQAPTDPMAGINAMLTTLGGTKTTTNAGNTAALEKVIADMQGQNPAAMLQSIFQAAGAQIPGIQSAMGRSVGARSGSNSAVNATLQKLLSQTTITAQDQLVKQQLANLQAQVAPAQTIAQTTQGTTKSTGTDLGEATKNLAILQLLSKSGILEKFGLGEAAKTVTGAAPVQTTGPMQPTAPVATAPAQMTGAEAPMALKMSDQLSTPAAQTSPVIDLSGAVASPVADFGPIYDRSGINLDMGPRDQAPVAYGDVIPGLEEWVMPAGVTLDDLIPPGINLADGGLVGRDGKVAKTEPEDDKDDTAEALANARFDEGFTANALMDSFRKLLGDSLGKSDSYADGGVISAAGSRRSANPTVVQDVVTNTGATTGNSLPAATTNLAAPTVFSLPIIPSSSPNKMLQSSGSSQDAGVTGGEIGGGGGVSATTGPFSPLSASTRGSLQTASQLNALSGLTGGPSIPGFGLVASLMAAPTAADLAKTGLTAAGNAISPGLGSLAGFAMNPSMSSGVNALSGLNPMSAIANIGLSLTGNASLGEIAQNIADTVNPNNPMSPTQQAEATAFQAALDAGGGMSSTGGGMTGADTVGSGSGYMADGGKIKGPGTGISDSIKINASKGEYMMSKDVVDALGVEFFDALQAAFHVPADVQRMRAA